VTKIEALQRGKPERLDLIRWMKWQFSVRALAPMRAFEDVFLTIWTAIPRDWRPHAFYGARLDDSRQQWLIPSAVTFTDEDLACREKSLIRRNVYWANKAQQNIRENRRGAMDVNLVEGPHSVGEWGHRCGRGAAQLRLLMMVFPKVV